MRRAVVVVGGGVSGLASAYYLLRRGHEVTVVERGAAGHDCCSLGNAGFISPSHFLPLASPGVVLQALRWLGDPESPFYVRPRLDPAFLSFALRFALASRASRAHRAGPLLRDLNVASRRLFEEIAEETGNDFGLTREGLLLLFQSARALAEEAKTAERARALGMPARVLDREGVRGLEPDLTLETVGGVHYPLDAHVAPDRFCATLERRIRDAGGTFVWNAEVRGWRSDGGRVRAAVTAAGDVGGDEFVLAAGSWSARLARGLGASLPLEPGKGYSMTLAAPPERPRRSVLLQECRVAVTPMGSSLRVGGTMELGAFSLSISPPRIRGIVRSFLRYFRAFSKEHFRSVRPWAGLRPCTPDGLPYLGRLRTRDNVVVAAGHAMMGLSMGPITGTLVAEIVSGDAPSIDIRGLDPGRYA